MPLVLTKLTVTRRYLGTSASDFYLTSQSNHSSQPTGCAVRPTTMPMQHRGSNGAITKPYRPSVSQRIARKTASKIIDLTQESEEEAGQGPEADSDQLSEGQQESEKHWESEEQAESEEQEGSEEHENSDAESQGSEGPEIEPLQDSLAMQVIPGISYSVTRNHHRPWGGGDEFGMVGIFNTEKEAKRAALNDFRDTCADEGWECYWRGDPGDKKIVLLAHVEDGEVQQETYTGTINRVQHYEKPSLPFIMRNEPQLGQRQAESSHVYVVQEERRLTLRSRGVENSSCSGIGNFKAFRLHYIYRDGDAANEAAQAVYEELFPYLANPKIVEHKNRHGLASIILEDQDEHMSYKITVEKRQLL